MEGPNPKAQKNETIRKIVSFIFYFFFSFSIRISIGFRILGFFIGMLFHPAYSSALHQQQPPFHHCT